MNDQEILLSLKNGNAYAFELVYQRYHTHVYLLANKCLKSEEDAKDVRANCFTKLWEAHDKLLFKNMNALYGWLRNTAFNNCIDQIRRTKIRAGKEPQLQAEILAEGKEIFEATDKEAAVINRAINKIEALPLKFKQVFKMRCYDELKFIEIAQLLGADVSTVKKRYARALKLIKAFMFITIIIKLCTTF